MYRLRSEVLLVFLTSRSPVALSLDPPSLHPCTQSPVGSTGPLPSDSRIRQNDDPSTRRTDGPLSHHCEPQDPTRPRVTGCPPRLEHHPCPYWPDPRAKQRRQSTSEWLWRLTKVNSRGHCREGRGLHRTSTTDEFLDTSLVHLEFTIKPSHPKVKFFTNTKILRINVFVQGPPPPHLVFFVSIRCT